MDKIERYKNIITKELSKHASGRISNRPTVEFQLIINEDRTQFVLLTVGWHDIRYIHGLLFNIKIKNNKVWVYEDRTDIDIASRLSDLGIKRSDIVLGFAPEWARGQAGYAKG